MRRPHRPQCNRKKVLVFSAHALRPVEAALGSFMKRDWIEQGRFTGVGRGLGTVTREMVLNRARELAPISGRGRVLEQDMQKAYCELTGEEWLEPGPELSEETRAEGLRKEGVDRGADEETFAQKLVEEGIEAAEHEQMLQASRQQRKRDRDEEAP
jgi:hypothetical protein